MFVSSCFRHLVGCFLALAWATALSAQTTHTWIGANASEWGYFGNWSSSAVPNSVTDAASFENSSSTPATLGVGLSGSPFTARGITVANTSRYSAVVLGTAPNFAAQSLVLAADTTARPVVSVAGGQLQINATLSASQGWDKTGDGALLLSGPVAGGPIFLRGGSVMLTGANSFAGTIINYPLTSPAPVAKTLETTLTLAGAAALPAGANLAFDLHSQVATTSTVKASMDLGGLARKVGSLTVGSSLTLPAHVDSNIGVDLRNGALATNAFNVYLSSAGTGTGMVLRLPDQFQANDSRLQIGMGRTAGAAPSLNSAKLVVGPNTIIRSSGIAMGYEGSSGRIEPWAPGSSLTISGRIIGNTTQPLSIDIGNFAATYAGYDSGIDMRDGFLYLTASRVSIRGGTSATAPTMAAIRFGGGNVDIGTLELGGSSQRAFDQQCLVVQGGGVAKVWDLRFANSSSFILNGDKRLLAYQLNGGTLELGRVVASSTVTTLNGSLTVGIQWTAGVIKNYTGNFTLISACSTITLAPFQLALSGSGTKTLQVDAGSSFTLGQGTRFSTDSETVAMNKTGEGIFELGGDTSGFSGLLRLNAGTLAVGSGTTVASASLGALTWNAGRLSFDLGLNGPSSDRLAITRQLSRGTGDATQRVLDLKFGARAGTYTLLTYASTDLTGSDFRVTGIRAGYAAEVTVGAGALTVTLAPLAGFTLWRSEKLGSFTNLGSADALADPDADGRPNLLEYALGGDPLAVDPAAGPSVAADTTADRLTLTFTRVADPALTYRVLAADDPSGPWAGEGAQTVFTSAGAENVAGAVTVVDSVALSAGGRRFMRLSVTR